MSIKTDFTYSFKKENYSFSQIWEKLSAYQKENDIGFFDLPDTKTYIEECEQALALFPQKKKFVQIGIGGSSLGPKMLISSLASLKTQRNFSFWENIDSDLMAEELELVDFNTTLFYIASKSGGTAETLALLAILLNKMHENGINKDQYKDHLVVVTGVKGDLLNFAKKHSIQTLTLPENVGGRFSVLTSCGLFPAMFAGIDTTSLLQGALNCKNQLIEDKPLRSDLISLALELLFQKNENGKSQTVIMPYSSKLKEFTFWFVQLWAESLGKKRDLSDNVVHTGLTPIASVGAIDQHSQVQLFMEGPLDKFILFIENTQTQHKLELTNCKLLSSFSLHDLMKAELYGTQLAAKEHGVPFSTMTIDRIDPYHLGELVFFFEVLTMLMGQLFKIDPFNQPGVEAGKIYAFEKLNAMTK